MAKKEAFTPIWNYDEPEAKKERKGAALKEPERERGERDREEKKEEPVYHGGMFEEDKIAHKMTKKKEKTVIIVVIIVAVIVSLIAGFLSAKWRHDAYARRYLAAPRRVWSETVPGGASGSAEV